MKVVPVFVRHGDCKDKIEIAAGEFPESVLGFVISVARLFGGAVKRVNPVYFLKSHALTEGERHNVFVVHSDALVYQFFGVREGTS